MSNEYFQPASVPAPNSPGSSSVMRSEFASIAAGFDKMPPLAGNGGDLIAVDPAGTRLISGGFNVNEIVTLNGIQTLTNKTLAWEDNTFLGFEEALGIDLKANIDSPSFTGTPTAPTPGTGDSSARIATTFFVTDTLAGIGATSPGDALPVMDGVASAGTPGTFIVSRVDHIHPSDTSRAPASATTAAGTSLTPVGGVAATNVQTAVQELDSEKAPLASPTFTGTPSAPTPAPMDTSTRLATTAWVQTTLAALPPAGMYPDNDPPLMNGVASAGVGAEASRGDHVHPTDTTRAPLASPTFTGTPAAPTPTVGDSTTKIATTAFVDGNFVAKAGATMTGTLTGTRLVAPKTQLGVSATAGENHFFDGSVANKLKLFRGTPDAPGAEVLAVDAGSVAIKNRITGPGTILAAAIIDGTVSGVSAPIAGFGISQINRTSTGTYQITLGASYPDNSFIVSALPDNGALNQVLWNSSSSSNIILNNYASSTLANCSRLFVTILRAD